MHPPCASSVQTRPPAGVAAARGRTGEEAVSASPFRTLCVASRPRCPRPLVLKDVIRARVPRSPRRVTRDGVRCSHAPAPPAAAPRLSPVRWSSAGPGAALEQRWSCRTATGWGLRLGSFIAFRTSLYELSRLGSRCRAFLDLSNTSSSVGSRRRDPRSDHAPRGTDVGLGANRNHRVTPAGAIRRARRRRAARV